MKSDRRAFLRMIGSFLTWPMTRLSAASTSSNASWDLAREVHRATRNTPRGALGVRLPKLRAAPAPFKVYPHAKRAKLPPPALEGTLPLGEAVRHYTPARAFRKEPASLLELARILHHTNGITGARGGRPLRAAPSAGALYAGEVYLVAERVRGLSPGLYYYGVVDHELLELRSGSFLGEVGRAVEDPGQLENAAAALLLTNVFARYTWRYANRGYRYALIDTGHIGENLRLAARSAGFADASPLRFHDDRLNSLLRLDGLREAVCAVHAIGRPAKEKAGSAAVSRRLGEQHSVLATSASRRRAITRYHDASKLVPSSAAEAPASSSPNCASCWRWPEETPPSSAVRASSSSSWCIG